MRTTGFKYVVFLYDLAFFNDLALLYDLVFFNV